MSRLVNKLIRKTCHLFGWHHVSCRGLTACSPLLPENVPYREIKRILTQRLPRLDLA